MRKKGTTHGTLASRALMASSGSAARSGVRKSPGAIVLTRIPGRGLGVRTSSVVSTTVEHAPTPLTVHHKRSPPPHTHTHTHTQTHTTHVCANTHHTRVHKHTPHTCAQTHTTHVCTNTHHTRVHKHTPHTCAPRAIIELREDRGPKASQSAAHSPIFARSRAIGSVIPTTAPLDAAYAAWPTCQVWW
jgi:hypothetical protein